MELNKGDIVTLKIEVLGNKQGSKGVVYDIYPDFDIDDRSGVCIIFENGEYDGFSVDEQERFLNKEIIESVPNNIINYNFKNVIKLSTDFENGFWDEIFK